MKKVLVLQCCLRRRAGCCSTPSCFPNCHSYQLDHSQNLLSHPRTTSDMAKIVLFPKSRQEVSTSPNFQSRRTSMFCLNICRTLELGYLWWYMKPILKWVVILDQNKGGRFLLWKSWGECSKPSEFKLQVLQNGSSVTSTKLQLWLISKVEDSKPLNR